MNRQVDRQFISWEKKKVEKNQISNKPCSVKKFKMVKMLKKF